MLVAGPEKDVGAMALDHKPSLSLSVNYLVFLSSSPFPVQLKLIKKTDLFRKAPLSLGHFGGTFPALHSSHESKTSRSHRRPALPFGYSQKGTDASHPISTKENQETYCNYIKKREKKTWTDPFLELIHRDRGCDISKYRRRKDMQHPLGAHNIFLDVFCIRDWLILSRKGARQI